MFSLLTKPWIPVAGRDPVSLNELFESDEAYELCGPVADQLACFLFLRALTQRACEDALEYREDWQDLTPEAFRRKVLDYLHKHEALFDLGGEKPFLQYPDLGAADLEKAWYLTEIRLGVAAGNTTILNETQSNHPLSDSELVCGFLRLVAIPFSGKRFDKTITLKKGLEKKSAAPALTMGTNGYLHNFVLADGLVETLRYNLLTKEDIEEYAYIKGIGVPPWERMPVSEENFQFTLYEFLFPIARFCLIRGDRIVVTDGVSPKLLPGMVPPSVAVQKKVKDTSKKRGGSSDKFKEEIRTLKASRWSLPWRHIDEILSFYDKDSTEWKCLQTSLIADRKGHKGIWSLGIQVAYQSGEQYMTASDGFVCQTFAFPDGDKKGSDAYARYTEEKQRLDRLVKVLVAVIHGYWSHLGYASDMRKDRVDQAVQYFWSECDNLKEDLENLCKIGERESYRRKTLGLVYKVFDLMCPKIPGNKRLEAWAKNRPFSLREEMK